jgi:hypothetical protein
LDLIVLREIVKVPDPILVTPSFLSYLIVRAMLAPLTKVLE